MATDGHGEESQPPSISSKSSNFEVTGSQRFAPFYFFYTPLASGEVRVGGTLFAFRSA
jgi:hypothetical protein